MLKHYFHLKGYHHRSKFLEVRLKLKLKFWKSVTKFSLSVIQQTILKIMPARFIFKTTFTIRILNYILFKKSFFKELLSILSLASTIDIFRSSREYQDLSFGQIMFKARCTVLGQKVSSNGQFLNFT